MDTEQKEMQLSEQQRNLKTLFILSYRYSQGNSELQHYLFRWLKDSHYISYSDITQVVPSYIQNISIPRLHTRNETTDIVRESSIETEWTAMMATLKNQSLILDEEPILDEMLKKDIEYQEKSRPNRKEKRGADSENDEFSSQVRKYVINDNPSGHEAFDKLFDKLREIVREDVSPRPGIKNPRISQLSNLWEINHPGEKFFPIKFIPTQSLQEA